VLADDAVVRGGEAAAHARASQRSHPRAAARARSWRRSAMAPASSRDAISPPGWASYRCRSRPETAPSWARF